MSSRSSSYKHYPHIFTPMQMIYNYANNIKLSVGEFFQEYLVLEGRDTLLLFNRYMVLVIALNLDIRLFFTLFVIGYVLVKLLRVRPWQRGTGVSVPMSFLNALYEYRKMENIKKIDNIRSRDQQESASPSVSSKSSLSNSSPRLPILCVQQKQQLRMELLEPTMGYFTPSQIEQFIYDSINALLSAYCQAIWYLKWNAIFVLWVITGLMYVLQPSSQYNTFKIKTKKNGAFEIGEIKKASEIINYFQLICFFLLANILLFYYYGTNRLRNELLLEVYSREYSYNMIKKRRLRTVRKSIHADSLYFNKSEKPLSQEPDSPIFFCTVVNKQKTVDLQELKTFSMSNTEHKFSHRMELPNMLSERKFNRDAPLVSIETPPKKPISKDLNIQIVELLQQSRVQSEEVSSQGSKNEVQQMVNNKNLIVKNQFNGKGKTALRYNNEGQQIGVMDSLITHPDKKGNQKRLTKKSFLTSSTDSPNFVLQKHRQNSQQYKSHQVYNDFRISLLKVQQTTTLNHQKDNIS